MISISRLNDLVNGSTPKICLKRGPGLGDVLMLTPSFKGLKEKFNQNIDITLATDLKYLDGVISKAMYRNPFLDSIISQDSIREKDYDVIVNLQCPCIPRETLGSCPPNRIDIFAETLGIQLDDYQPFFYVSNKEKLNAENILKNILPQEKIILVQPSASNSRRSFSHRKLKRILTVLSNADSSLKIFVLTHDSDFDKATYWDNINRNVKVLKNFDVRQIAAIMSLSHLVLCQDSSILHLAGALDIPSVGLFGPTHPQSRINRYPKATAVWTVEHIQRCPCWWDQLCPLGNLCWDSITPELVINACLSQLEKYY